MKNFEQTPLKEEDYSFKRDGKNRCVLKVPTSDNPEVRNSYIAYLLRDISRETKEDALKKAMEFAGKYEEFSFPCKRINCEGCRTLKLYERKIMPPVLEQDLTIS